MDNNKQNASPAENAPPRAIPPLPGGGSWRFDEPSWAWISNDPSPQAPAEQPAAADQITSEV
jgi:hypothetical protein